MALRVVFFGTPEFAAASFSALLSSRHSVVAVVTQPDRARGRGLHVTSSAVKTAAEGIVPVLQPERLKDESWLQTFRNLQPDLAIVAAYGRLLPQGLLDLPRLGTINVHASLLPRWRGAAPVHRAILAGDAVTGVTIMRDTFADTTRAQAELGFAPSKSLESGLAAESEWLARLIGVSSR